MVAVIMMVLSVAACTSTLSGPEGVTAEYRWIRGELASSLAAPLPDVESAVRGAFDELGLVGLEGSVDGLKGRLSARMAVGTKVRVRLQALDFESTSIRIRVGKIGDRAVSLQLLRHIERRL
jgi:hypothetical protein